MKKKKNILIVCCLLFALSLPGCGLRNMAGLSGGEAQVGQEDSTESGMGAGLSEERYGTEAASEPVPEDETAENADSTSDETAKTADRVSGEAAEKSQKQTTSAGHYVYTTLDGEGQKVYDEIYQTILSHTESVRVSTLDTAVLDAAYKAVTADYGGIFWVSGYVYTQYSRGDELIGLDFAPGYTMTQDERDKLQVQIDEKTEEILGAVAEDASDYEKVKYVFDYLAANVDYVTGAENNQNIISVFLNRETVCQGYACATQYLLDLLGVQSAVVTGEANGQSHAWNLVRMDGEYYYVDTTWGNSTFASEQLGEARFINYNYFGVTTEEISVTHTPNSYFVLPDCTATQDNYYVRENLYFSEWNPEGVGALCGAGYETGNTTISIRFASDELYGQARDYFIGERHIADYCTGITSFYYVEDTLQHVLTFCFL